MYKVTAYTSGKHQNIVLGARYCLTRKSAIKVANLFLEDNCLITIEKFIHCGYSFMWSNAWEETKIIFERDKENILTVRKANKYDF